MDRSPDDRDALAWTWARGADTPAAAFGDPRVGDAYDVCLYGAAGTLAFRAGLPAGGVCDGVPCWTALSSGFRYRSPARTPDGIEKVVLHAGPDGAAKVAVRGKAEHLVGLPAPPLGLPLRVQLQRAAGGCWEAWFVAARRNQPGRFTASGSPAPPTTTTTSTSTSTTLGGGAPSCGAVFPPPASCAADAGCPPGYTCAAGTCRGAPCLVRDDCPLGGECVYQDDATVGVCTCWGCGAPSCPLGCRYTVFASGCMCEEEQDCPPEDDVCFLGFCS